MKTKFDTLNKTFIYIQIHLAAQVSVAVSDVIEPEREKINSDVATDNANLLVNSTVRTNVAVMVNAECQPKMESAENVTGW